MWRPVGLINPYRIQIVGPIPTDAEPTAFTAFEAGVDALLDTLREKGQHYEAGVSLEAGTLLEIDQPGVLVFIPDEKK